MGPVNALQALLVTARRFCLSGMAAATGVFSAFAPAQPADFDFGDGRHGSVTLPAGETTVQELWSQVRRASDLLAYDPENSAQVPNLENLTISPGGTLTVSPFTGSAGTPVDPAQGGVLRIKVRGTLTIQAGAAISATGRGYRGGTLEGAAPGHIGQQGDSWGNTGAISGESNRGGGGGGFGEINGGADPGAGGGGGHREAGQPGTTGQGTNTAGLGGQSFDAVATTLGQGFREAYPFPRFGSGGGRGGQTATFANVGAQGGNGGGVIIIEASRIVNNGAIAADGAAGGSNLSGGGGGAGGSIQIHTLSEQHGTVTADGGAGGAGSVLGNNGGAGGAGVILWDARFELETAVDGEGEILLTPAGGRYDDNTVVEVEAVPAEGWMFAGWEGDLSGDENPTEITMGGDRAITAVFVELPTLAVSPTLRDVGPSGGEVSFDVEVTGGAGAIDWIAAVTSGADFITITSGTTGTNTGAVTVAVAPNPNETTRTGTFVVSSGDVGSEPVTVTITQGPATPFLSVTPAEQIAAAEGEELVIQVRNTGTGTFDWTAAVVAGHSYATITSANTGTDDGTFVVSVAENLSPSQRIIRLSVSAPGALGSPAQVTITQLAGVPFLQVTPSSQLIGSAAGAASINVANGGSGSLGWTAAVIEGAGFATVTSGSSGVNAGQVAVSFQANTTLLNRTATIRVESPDAANSPVDVTITQTAQEAVLQVSPESQAIGSGAGTASYQVVNAGSGTMNWTASVVSGANFLTISTGTSGINEGAITVAAAANATSAERTGTLRIDAPGAANSPMLVTLTQEGRAPILQIAPLEQSVGAGGGNISITVENGGTGALNWTASVSTGAEFLSLTPPSNGAGDGVVQIAVSANATGRSRTGTVVVEAAGATGSPITATIVQIGCLVLDAPQNLAASDGSYPDSVELIWSAVPGATGYEIYRSIYDVDDRFELMATTTEPRFSDTTAKGPGYEIINRGCYNPGEFVIYNVVYHYEVRAINPCGASERSNRTSGYRGLPADDDDDDGGEEPDDGGEEPTVPAAKSASGEVLLRSESRAALRLGDAAGLDLGTLWLAVNGDPAPASDFFWRPLVEGDNTDGWVVFTAVDEVAPGEAFTLSAGATALDGVEVSVEADFIRDPGEVKSSGEVSVAPYLPEGEDTGLFKAGLGMVFQAAPVEVYDAPVRIAIPIPDHVSGEALTLYYLGTQGGDPAWYPAERVGGLLAGPVTVSEDGSSLEVWVNHGGTLRLGHAPARAAAASLAPDWGALLMIGVTIGLLGLLSRRRRAAVESI